MISSRRTSTKATSGTRNISCTDKDQKTKRLGREIRGFAGGPFGGGRRIGAIAAALALAAIVSAMPLHATTIQSDFEDGTPQGWSFEGDVETFTVESGGPPGSTKYLQLVDLGLGPVMLAVAPPAFHGDWTEFENVGVLSADEGLLSLVSGDRFGAPVQFRISGPGGLLRKDFAYPPLGPFIHYAVPIRESEWTVVSGTWAGVISNVTGLRITAEFATGFDTTGINNVKLTNDFTMDWYSIDGGGEMTTTGDDFTLSGTIGQLDATKLDVPTTDAAGQLELVGGFWAVAGGGAPISGDCDNDGDADLADFAGFETCLLGPDGGLTVGCECFDLDQNGRVDLRDFAAFTLSFTG